MSSPVAVPEPAVQAVQARPSGFTGTDAMLSAMVVVWGINFIVIKAALGVMHPLSFNAVRFTLAAFGVVGFAMLRGTRMPPRARVLRLFVLGALGNTVYQLCFIEGVSLTRAGNAALIMAAVPVQTAIIGHFRGSEPLRPREVAGLAVSTAGIALIVVGSGQGVSFGGTVLGDLLMLAATVCWSVYTVGTKPLVDEFGPTAATAWTMALGAIPLLLITSPWVIGQDWAAVTAPAWGAVMFSAFGALVVAYLIWYRGVQRLGPSRTALYSNFTPVVALLAAWAFLGETPNLWQVVGAAGIFTGIYLTRT